MSAIDRNELLTTVKRRPGITTPEIAETFGVSIHFARWAVHQCEELEFYDGNQVRFKENRSNHEAA